MQSIWSRKTNIVVLISLACVLIAQNGRAATSEKGWRLEQESKSTDKQVVFVGADYLRVENPRAGTISVAHAPEWRVITYNPTKKIYVETPLLKFDGKFAKMVGSLTRSPLGLVQFRKEGIVDYHGVRSREYKTPLISSPNHEEITEEVKNAQLLVLDDPLIPSQAGRVVANFYDLPPMGAVLLEARYETPSKSSGKYKTNVPLKTTSCKQCSIAVDAVDLHKFKKLKDEQAFVNENNGGTLDLNDFVDYMGTKKQLPKKE